MEDFQPRQGGVQGADRFLDLQPKRCEVGWLW
jgi:hypothetical protein